MANRLAALKMSMAILYALKLTASMRGVIPRPSCNDNSSINLFSKSARLKVKRRIKIFNAAFCLSSSVLGVVAKD